MTKKGHKGGHKKAHHSRAGLVEFTKAKRAAINAARWLLPWAALVQQTTSGDVAYAQGTGYFGKLSALGKIELIVGDFISRLSNGNFAPFPNVGGAVKPSWNLSNTLNKWTGAGILGMIYGVLPFKLPEKAAARDTGFWTLLAGIAGGLLDDPPQSNAYNAASPKGNFAAQAAARGSTFQGQVVVN